MDIVAGISAVKSAVDIAKAMMTVGKSFDEAVHKSNITDLLQRLTDVRHALMEAQELIRKKDSEIERLKKVAIDRSGLKTGEDGYSYKVNEYGKPVGFPVCPNCDVSSDRLIQLVEHQVGNQGKCPICEQVYLPVTFYMPDGGTLYEHQVAERKRKTSEENQRIFKTFDDLNRI